jgi:general secretion pathway protein A
MSKSRLLIVTGFIPAVLALTVTGCATKKYVSAQIAPVNAKVAALETAAKEQTDKEQADVSRVEARIAATDSKVAEAAAAADRANNIAAQANQLGQQNQAAIASNGSAIAANGAAIQALEKSMNYSLVAKGEVTFGFNRSNLDKADQGTLDSLVQQARSAPRAEFELLGFTDQVGTPAYNLELSRRRAESVARYLVHQGITVRGVHLVGLGKEPVPSDWLADAPAVDPNARDARSRQLARRVVIRIYAPAGNPPGATVTSSQQ